MKEKVANYLKTLAKLKTPTEIGLALGKNYNTASSFVSNPFLKKLVDDGVVYKMKIDGKVLWMVGFAKLCLTNVLRNIA